MVSFLPPRALRGRHVQSVLGSIGLRRLLVLKAARGLIAASDEQIVDCGAGVRLLCQHTPPIDRNLNRVAVVIHGWEGSSSSTYLLSAASRLWQSGYRVIRLNLRDHGDSHHLNEAMFHSCRLSDAVGAVRWVREEYPQERLFLGGFSLGGNFALRVAAESAQHDLDLAGVVAVCPVLDPAMTMNALDTGAVIYQHHFLRKWRRSLHKKKAAFPHTYNFSRLERFNTLTEMTDYFVRHYTEYPSLEVYLQGYALTGNRLAELKTPARMLLADDDPVIPVGDIERVATPPDLRVDRSRYGGHCGFISGYDLRGWVDGYIVSAFDSLVAPCKDNGH